MGATAAEREAMTRALALAATPGVPLGPNPRVGCVLLAPDGEHLASGFHRGSGTPHAEVDALGLTDRALGATAVITLEPCNHIGRTGPCTEALIAAGVSRVVFAQPDPNPVAAGGAERLAAAGLSVEAGLFADDAARVNLYWRFGIQRGRPFVTWKFATTLDGRSAAADGTSRWVSGRTSRLDTHRIRALADVVLVGSNTVEVDDPRLTVRDEHDLDVRHQPLRAVMGCRDLAPDRRVLDDSAETLLLRTHDPREALRDLFALGRRHVFLEGGPTLAASFLREHLVDEVVAYVAPMLLGAGRPAVADLGIVTIAGALRLDLHQVEVLGDDVRLVGAPRHVSTADTPAGNDGEGRSCSPE